MQDVHITYPQDQLLATVERLGACLQAHTEEVSIVDYGYCQKQDHAYIVLEWPDEVDEAFLHHLDEDAAVLDYSVYTVPCGQDDPPLSLALSLQRQGGM